MYMNEHDIVDGFRFFVTLKHLFHLVTGVISVAVQETLGETFFFLAPKSQQKELQSD